MDKDKLVSFLMETTEDARSSTKSWLSEDLNRPIPRDTVVHESVLIHKGLLEFFTKLSKAMPGIAMGFHQYAQTEYIEGYWQGELGTATSRDYVHGVSCYTSATFYYPEDTFVVGRVDCLIGRASGGGTSVRKLTVYSRNEHNKSRSRTKRRSTETSNLTTAVNTAKKFFTRYSPEEVMRESASTMRLDIYHQAFGRNTDALQEKAYHLVAGYNNNGTYAFAEDLRRIVDSGFLFSASVQPRVQALIDAYDKHRDTSQYGARGIYVHIDSAPDGLVAHTLHVDAMNTRDLEYNVRDKVVTTVPADQLPELVMERMAITNMYPPLTWVEGVGVRLDDRRYWMYA